MKAQYAQQFIALFLAPSHVLAKWTKTPEEEHLLIGKKMKNDKSIYRRCINHLLSTKQQDTRTIYTYSN